MYLPNMYRLSDESGSMEFSLVAEGSLSRSMLESKDGKNFYQSFIVAKHHVSISILTCVMSVCINVTYLCSLHRGQWEGSVCMDW